MRFLQAGTSWDVPGRTLAESESAMNGAKSMTEYDVARNRVPYPRPYPRLAEDEVGRLGTRELRFNCRRVHRKGQKQTSHGDLAWPERNTTGRPLPPATPGHAVS